MTNNENFPEENPEKKKETPQPVKPQEKQPESLQDSPQDWFGVTSGEAFRDFLQSNMETEINTFSPDENRINNTLFGDPIDSESEAEKISGQNGNPETPIQPAKIEENPAIPPFSENVMFSFQTDQTPGSNEADPKIEKIYPFQDELTGKTENEFNGVTKPLTWEEMFPQGEQVNSYFPNDGLYQTEPGVNTPDVNQTTNSVPADNNIDEKVDALRRNLEPAKAEELDEPNSQFQFEKPEAGWQESDSKLLELQGMLSTSAPKERDRKDSFLQELVKDFTESSLLLKGIIIGAILFIVILVLYIASSFIKFDQTIQTPAPVPTINAEMVPYPIALQFPGGWNFDLNQGSINNGTWNPTGAEWLKGTEISRLVSIPWSKQVDAVYNTIAAGDNFQLTMSNKDLLAYKVEVTQTIRLDQLDQIINRNSPSLVIIITKPETSTRKVVIAGADLSNQKGNSTSETNKSSTLQLTITPSNKFTPTP